MQDPWEDANVLSQNTVKEEPESPDESETESDDDYDAGVHIKKELEEEFDELDSKVQIQQEISFSILKRGRAVKEEVELKIAEIKKEVFEEQDSIKKRILKRSHDSREDNPRGRTASTSSSAGSSTDSWWVTKTCTFKDLMSRLKIIVS